MKARSKIRKTISTAAFWLAAALCFAQFASAQAPLALEYEITQDGEIFTAVRLGGGGVVGAPSQSIQAVIDAIRDNAAGSPCTIIFSAGSFGGESAGIDIGYAYILFEHSNGPWESRLWGLVTLSGKVSSGSTGVIMLADDVSIISDADITNTSPASGSPFSTPQAYGIFHGSTGSVTIKGGKVSSRYGNAISNESTGSVIIAGGTVSTETVVAIHNRSSGSVTVSRGTVEATGINSNGYWVASAIRNTSTGTVTVSGGTVSANGSGTMISNAIRNESTGAVVITGGTVEVTSGVAVEGGAGPVTISGGVVSATVGRAIRHVSNGKITISGDARVTSAGSGAMGGTILLGVGTSTAERLAIQGGTVENTSDDAIARAIISESVGAVNISGGRVLAKNGHAIYKSGAGAVNLTGNSLVFAYGTGVVDVVYGNYTQGGSSVILAWNRAAGTTNYAESSNTDLFMAIYPPPPAPFPVIAASARWAKRIRYPDSNITIHGIEYDHGANTGFIEIEGVTVGGTSAIAQTPGRANGKNSAHFVQVSGHTLQVRMSDRGKIEVYALNGAKLRAFDLGSGVHTLRMNDLPRGTYMVRASSGASWGQSTRMVVR